VFFYIRLMKTMFPVYWPQFYTATCYEWLHLLDNDKYKNIIVRSLQYLVANKRIELNAFAIINNHIHLIWQMQPGHEPSAVQLSFMRFTAQQIKFELLKDAPDLTEKCKVNKGDRNIKYGSVNRWVSIYLMKLSLFRNSITFIIIL
jgi:putative transposase